MFSTFQRHLSSVTGWQCAQVDWLCARPQGHAPWTCLYGDLGMAGAPLALNITNPRSSDSASPSTRLHGCTGSETFLRWEGTHRVHSIQRRRQQGLAILVQNASRPIIPQPRRECVHLLSPGRLNYPHMMRRKKRAACAMHATRLSRPT